jgi:hypothetical protein
MASNEDSKLFVTPNSDLLREAQETIIFSFEDGNGEIALTEANLPPTVDFKNPYTFDLTQFIPNQNPMTLDRFFLLAKNLIDDASSRSGKPTVSITEEYPPEDMAKFGNEVISYRVISREPANMSTDGERRPHRRFRPSYTVKDPDVGDNIIQVHTRPLDHDIEFTCWATSNKLANKRVLWLENLFVAHTWAFKIQGADRFIFERRLSDGYMTVNNQRLIYRPLRFKLRFNEFQTVASYELKNVLLAISQVSSVEE